MLSFGSAATSPEFVPGDDARDWIATGIVDLAAQLGAPAQRPQLLTEPTHAPSDLDDLFDMICGVQEVVGQAEVELTLLELDARGQAPKLPEHYTSLGDSGGKLLHTLEGPEDFLLLFTPAVFKVRELLLAGIARELGRVALVRAGLKPNLADMDAAAQRAALLQWEADAELAGILLGMGIWVANGSYLFENACCGGGCGVDLRSMRAGLSMPEACYALAIDSQRKGMRRRAVVRHLSPTQKAATKQCWNHLGRALPPALAAAEPQVRGRLGA